ncbi:MAG: hypothetical protein MK102_17040 [Fuerstiella sp.]|nr:hypothetical protein [Fuerstiella sp.]
MPRNKFITSWHRGISHIAPTVAVCVSIGLCLSALFQIARFNVSKATLTQSSESARPKSHPETKPGFQTKLIRGQVVWLANALESTFGISTVPEVAKNALAIQTKDKQLFPIVENLRGRAFRMDSRLREKEIEILARLYDDQPLVQVIRVYEIVEDKRYELDYWCDVCAIVMFETGPCACCQDNNRLRRQLADDNVTN